MLFSVLLLPLLPLLVQSTNIVLSNDDGWAEINIRVLYDFLTRAGNSVVLSAPADNRSGTGSSDTPATPRTEPCEFNSCPTGSPPTGFNASNPRLNYVNSFPVTSMRYGIQTLSPKFFNGPSDLAVAGFNVGANLGPTTLISGTVGAATEAALEGIPALAFSGTSGSQIAYTTSPIPGYVTTYASLSTTLTSKIIASGKPFLPSNIWLNINFPTSNSSTCAVAKDFKFVLTRTNTAAAGAAKDVVVCGNKGRLPTEKEVVARKDGCFVSVSVGKADTKGDAGRREQEVVAKKLKGLL
ncbi:MAG: hypothetical protein Q9168_006633, partial [Polycauliona sp. 1 TL-2023]